MRQRGPMRAHWGSGAFNLRDLRKNYFGTELQTVCASCPPGAITHPNDHRVRNIRTGSGGIVLAD